MFCSTFCNSVTPSSNSTHPTVGKFHSSIATKPPSTTALPVATRTTNQPTRQDSGASSHIPHRHWVEPRASSAPKHPVRAALCRVPQRTDVRDDREAHHRRQNYCVAGCLCAAETVIDVIRGEIQWGSGCLVLLLCCHTTLSTRNNVPHSTQQQQWGERQSYEAASHLPQCCRRRHRRCAAYNLMGKRKQKTDFRTRTPKVGQ